jgi:hypothetical protein
MQKVLYCIVLLFIQTNLLAQIPYLQKKLPPHLIQLFQQQKEMQDISFRLPQENALLLPDEFEGNSHSVKFNRLKNQLIFTVEGTNRVYQVEPDGSITRKDITRHLGANYGASVFTYNDTLYSLGGYGFWTVSGALRFYNETSREWDVIRNISDIGFANGINAISLFDQKNASFYVIYVPAEPEYVKKVPAKEQLLFQSFSLKTKQWLAQPMVINPEIATKLSDLKLIQKAGNGIIVTSLKKNIPLLFDFANNQLLEINDKVHTEFEQLLGSNPNALVYYTNENVIIYNIPKDSLIVTSIADRSKMSPLDLPVYIEPEINFSANYKIGGLAISSLILNALLILLLAGGTVYFRKKTSYKNLPGIGNNAHSPELQNITDFVNSLTEIEKATLLKIISNNLEGHNTTVTQLNKIQGTEQKLFKIQNNIRGEVLTLINKKFVVYSRKNDNLIERKRSDIDKRQMEYYINVKYLQKFSPVILHKL